MRLFLAQFPLLCYAVVKQKLQVFQMSVSRNWRIGKIGPGVKYARTLRPGGLPITAMELRVSVNQPQLFVSKIFSIKIHTGGKSCA